MVKRKQRAEPAVSLFPFLSILACVIGVLTLMISALALSQLEQESRAADKYERSDDYKELEKEIEVEQQELDKIKQAIADAEQTRNELNEARLELEKLQAEQLAKATIEQTTIELAEQANRLEEQIAELEAKLVKPTAKIAELKEELLRREGVPKEPPVIIRASKRRPRDNAPELDFTFVECRSGEVVIYDGQERTSVARNSLGSRDQPFFQLVERVAEAQDTGACLLLMVRSDAYGTYSDAQRIARSRRCLTSKLPIPGNGEVDVSAFSEPE